MVFGSNVLDRHRHTIFTNLVSSDRKHAVIGSNGLIADLCRQMDRVVIVGFIVVLFKVIRQFLDVILIAETIAVILGQFIIGK